MIFGKTAKVLAKRLLKYYQIPVAPHSIPAGWHHGSPGHHHHQSGQKLRKPSRLDLLCSLQSILVATVEAQEFLKKPLRKFLGFLPHVQHSYATFEHFKTFMRNLVNQVTPPVPLSSQSPQQRWPAMLFTVLLLDPQSPTHLQMRFRAGCPPALSEAVSDPLWKLARQPLNLVTCCWLQ